MGGGGSEAAAEVVTSPICIKKWVGKVDVLSKCYVCDPKLRDLNIASSN